MDGSKYIQKQINFMINFIIIFFKKSLTQAGLLLVMSLGMISCTSISKKTTAQDNERTKEQEQLLNSEKLTAQTYFEKGQYDKAIDVLKGTILKYPSSPYEQLMKLDIARNYYFLGDYNKSIEIYREVIAATQNTQPEIASNALFLSSMSYEALGDHAKTLASLKDSLRFRKYLPEERIFAEIPARMASIYQRMGEKAEAMAYFQMAERGSSQLKKRKQVDKTFLARIYFQMGELHIQTITPETIPMHIESLQMLQLFSLRSIEEDDFTWSHMASKNLSQVYQSIWENIKSLPENPELDKEASQKQKKEIQFKQAGNLLKVIQEFKHYIFPNPNSNQDTHNSVDSNLTPLLQQTVSFVDDLGQDVSNFMMTLGEYNSLTKESLERKSVKKNILLPSEPVFPVEKGLPQQNPEQIPYKDPNL